MKRIPGLSSARQQLFPIICFYSYQALQKTFRPSLILFCLHCISGQPGFGQWSSDPDVNTLINDRSFVGDFFNNIIRGNDGHFIIAWTDERSGISKDVYAQRINSHGVVQWRANGIPACVDPKEQLNPLITSDGAGGTIIVWTDHRPPPIPTDVSPSDVYAQRINANGEIVWPASGLPVCTAADNQAVKDIISDGNGGAFIIWTDQRVHLKPTIYLQHINAAGKAEWKKNGIAVCPEYVAQFPTLILSDDGNIIVTWTDERGSVYAQLFNRAGEPQWETGGVRLCHAAPNQLYPSIISDGQKGAIISWLDKRKNEREEIYAQRINSKGELLWPSEGILVASKVGWHRNPRMIPDDMGGAIFTWDDHRNGNNVIDVYAQRLDTNGAKMWTAGGVAICTTLNRQYWASIVRDGSGGAIITWQDRELAGSFNNDIYAQRIDAAGNILWANNGLAISTATNDQFYPAIASHEAGGAVIAWADSRNGIPNALRGIYAQYVSSKGILGCISPAITDQPLVSQTIFKDSIPVKLRMIATGDELSYQWFSNTTASRTGAASLGGSGTASEFTPSTAIAGTFYYYCQLTGNCDTLYSNFAEVIVNAPSPTPVPARAGELEIIVTPNPTETEFNVVVRSPGTEDLELRVLDLLGRTMIYRQGFPDEIFRLGKAFATGMYIIEVRQAGRKAVKKVMKQ